MMKKFIYATLVMLMALMGTVSCSPDKINDNDKQLNTELQGVSRGVKRPGTQGH